MLLGNDDGTFQTRQDSVVGDSPRAVVTGDFDADGKIDSASANYQQHTVSVLLGIGNGTFLARHDFGTALNPASITIATRTPTASSISRCSEPRQAC